MGYDIFKFGALYLNDKVQRIPLQPIKNGDVPCYDDNSQISIKSAEQKEYITWVKPHGFNLLVADRVLLIDVSWENLDKNGFVEGKSVLIDGQRFRCRLLQVGTNKDVPNEWDEILNVTGKKDSLWHWNKMFFLGVDAAEYGPSMFRAIRGFYSARRWGRQSIATKKKFVGFRPILDLLPSDNSTSNTKLDGIDFWLGSIPGGEGFCPILQPIREDVFKDILVEGKVRMYTFTKAGRPVHMDEPVKDPNKLTLTDRYFGNEYLVPWTISNGVAVASQSLKQQI